MWADGSERIDFALFIRFVVVLDLGFGLDWITDTEVDEVLVGEYLVRKLRDKSGLG